MNVSVISTVYNEGNRLEDMLESLLKQTKDPDEIVIVDGGSNDGTWETLQRYASEKKHIKAVQEECNIAEGRNIAVRGAKHDIILGIDGGCVADDKWVERMLHQFEEGADAVAGMFEPLAENIFEFVQGKVVTSSYTADSIEKGERAPSSRSIGFRRSVWDEVGGYPEHLYTGEDTRFNSLVQEAGYEFAPAPEAVVYWHMRPDIGSLTKQYFRYGEGDARAGNIIGHPSNLFGISKNVLLLLSNLLVLGGLVLTPIKPYFISFALVGLLAPYCYHAPQLMSCITERGLVSAPYWLLVVTSKTWGYFAGFMVEALKRLVPRI